MLKCAVRNGRPCHSLCAMTHCLPATAKFVHAPRPRLRTPYLLAVCAGWQLRISKEEHKYRK